MDNFYYPEFDIWFGIFSVSFLIDSGIAWILFRNVGGKDDWQSATMALAVVSAIFRVMTIFLLYRCEVTF